MADAITLLRDQIAEAQSRLATSGAKGVLFGLGEITLELGMELTHTNGIDGGLRFSVASIGGKRESANKSTHKITVLLKPSTPDDGPVNVHDTQ